MKINSLAENILAAIIALIPLGYLSFIWKTLPEKVPLHFGIDGQPDRFGARKELWIVPILFSIMGFGVYALMKNIHKIDPKQAAKLSVSVFRKLGFTLLIFMSLLSIYIIQSTVNQRIDNFLSMILGLVFIVLGNLMHSLKQNYFFGLRLPWTLENENNWRKTHQYASKIWVVGGLFIVITGLILPLKSAMSALFVTVLFMVLIPSIFSYRYFKKGNP
jgi:uncharacterized membrane protein